MNFMEEDDEIRWQVVKAMLDEFPKLREKVKEYLEKQQKQKSEAQSLDFKYIFSSAVGPAEP